MPYFAGRMLASKIDYSVRNSARRIYLSLFGNDTIINSQALRSTWMSELGLRKPQIKLGRVQILYSTLVGRVRFL